MDRGGCGRAPDSYHTGTKCSRRIARRAAARSSASSSSVEEMNTRTRWSGVKITSVSAITSQASPHNYEDHLHHPGTREPELAHRPQDHTTTSWCAHRPASGPEEGQPIPKPGTTAQAGQRRRIVSHIPTQIYCFGQQSQPIMRLSAYNWAVPCALVLTGARYLMSPVLGPISRLSPSICSRVGASASGSRRRRTATHGGLRCQQGVLS